MNEEKRRDLLQQITTWAEKYNLGDEDWVEENFEFNDDGSVICNTDLELNSMTEPDFPESIKYVLGSLYLDGLTSAEGLELPDEIECLSLDGLTSAEGLDLTNLDASTYVHLYKMPYEEKQKLLKKYPNLRAGIGFY